MKHLPIQIVDEDDNPSGEAQMLEAQEKGLIHRVVRVMVEDGKGKILLQKRSATMHNWPNRWDNSAAGHVDAGEDYLTAAKRELFEELGIKDVALTEIDTYFTDLTVGSRKFRRFNRLYKVTYPKTPKNIDPEEVSDVKWVTLDELRKLISSHPEQFTDGIKDIVVRYY